MEAIVRSAIGIVILLGWMTPTCAYAQLTRQECEALCRSTAAKIGFELPDEPIVAELESRMEPPSRTWIVMIGEVSFAVDDERNTVFALADLARVSAAIRNTSPNRHFSNDEQAWRKGEGVLQALGILDLKRLSMRQYDTDPKKYGSNSGKMHLRAC